MYEYFDREVGLLGKETLETIADEWCMVICEAADADERSGSHVNQTNVYWVSSD